MNPGCEVTVSICWYGTTSWLQQSRTQEFESRSVASLVLWFAGEPILGFNFAPPSLPTWCRAGFPRVEHKTHLQKVPSEASMFGKSRKNLETLICRYTPVVFRGRSQSLGSLYTIASGSRAHVYRRLCVESFVCARKK
jgi:hypothetical protein